MGFDIYTCKLQAFAEIRGVRCEIANTDNDAKLTTTLSGGIYLAPTLHLLGSGQERVTKRGCIGRKYLPGMVFCNLHHSVWATTISYVRVARSGRYPFKAFSSG